MCDNNLLYYGKMRLAAMALVLLFAGPPAARAARPGSPWDNAYWWSMARFFETMRSYYEAGESRIKSVNNKRFEFENTKEYEEGYVMGEIIERYRTMVEHVQAMHKYKSYNYMDCLLRVEQIQKIYFEVYHLVNMMHELPRKYGQAGRDFGAGPIESNEIPDNIDDKELDRIYSFTKDRESKKKLKELRKKLKLKREMFELYGKWTTFHTTKRTGWWWPLEYGWEIDYYW